MNHELEYKVEWILRRERRDIIEVCKRLYDRGLVSGTDGNVSIRLSSDRLICTPSGMSKGYLETDDLVVCDMQGNRVQGKHPLTTEIKIHLAAYEKRSDVCAVVHAHPPYATAFAVVHETLDERLMPEAYISIGKVALTPYGTPSTPELENSVRPAVADHNAILLANHGAMTLGRDVMTAFHKMEALEQLAHISTITRMLGNATPLNAAQLTRLDEIRSVYGAENSNEPCYQCGSRPGDRPHLAGVQNVPSPNKDLSLDELRDMARSALHHLRNTRD